MAFTMRVTNEGGRRPTAVCDRCNELTTLDGMVLWGRQAVDPTSGRPLPFTAVVADPTESLGLATVAVACSETCASLLRWMYDQAEIELEYISVGQFIVAFMSDYPAPSAGE